MKRWPGIVALVVAVVGVGVMLLPTMEMHWGVDPALGVDPPVSRHSWFDPILPGCGHFDAPLALLAGMTGVLRLGGSVRRGLPSRLAVGFLVASAALPLLGSWVFGSPGWIALMAPIAMGISAAVVVPWRRHLQTNATSLETHARSEL
ncbi:hypothetical protein FOJ82_01110 [Tessaracoccus rhinocerotis]|uniref:DUF998 domain-containing protein n=1 Tax=Tessaracoccus rhinocerotis TaxID=1689449 RepID=A0A553K4B4_9ACTN|nr:hypothetical protein [Tessaracoccus rhinocerotis]TRY19532.1 hypothetical protein FOJ82_01110 [Tessaracoccus rhinocerotis]